jgi:hypothetical protein
LSSSAGVSRRRGCRAADAAGDLNEAWHTPLEQMITIRVYEIDCTAVMLSSMSLASKRKRSDGISARTYLDLQEDLSPIFVR